MLFITHRVNVAENEFIQYSYENLKTSIRGTIAIV